MIEIHLAQNQRPEEDNCPPEFSPMPPEPTTTTTMMVDSFNRQQEETESIFFDDGETEDEAGAGEEDPGTESSCRNKLHTYVNKTILIPSFVDNTLSSDNNTLINPHNQHSHQSRRQPRQQFRTHPSMTPSWRLQIFGVLIAFVLFSNLKTTTFAQRQIGSHLIQFSVGSARGQKYEKNGNKMVVVKGIQYAKPPIGPLRFKRPERLERWFGENPGNKYKNPCIQFMPFHQDDEFAGQNIRQNQNESCLYLNIFAPWEDGGEKNKKYPIVVWVHGGSFLAGSADTTINDDAVMDNFVSRGVMLITLNYRLGPLGFLVHRTADGRFHGNNGIYDILMALKWIQAEVKFIHGDSDSVTLMGESAGAAAVSALALSPLTQDLIHGAIIMSGSSSASWAVYRGTVGRRNPRMPNWAATNIAKYLTCEKQINREDRSQLENEFGKLFDDCNMFKDKFECPEFDGNDEEVLVECLRNQLNFTSALQPFTKGLSHELQESSMVVDGELIPDTIDNMLRNGSYVKIPILIGTADAEWAHKKATANYDLQNYEQCSESFSKSKIAESTLYRFKKDQEISLPNSTLELIVNSTFHEYLNSQTPNSSWDTLTLVRTLQQLEADLEFHSPLMREVNAYSNSGQKVWIYSFAHIPESPLTEEEKRSLDFFGQKAENPVSVERKVVYKEAFHGLDHAYIFTEGVGSNFKFNFSDREKEMATYVNDLFTNFIKYQNPTKNYENVTWKRYDPTKPSYLKLVLPPEQNEGVLKWKGVRYWNEYVPYLTEYSTITDPTASHYNPLTDEERLQLAAYERAWWALWLLVAAIAILLWTVIICLVAKKCLSPQSKPIDHVIVMNSL